MKKQAQSVLRQVTQLVGDSQGLASAAQPEAHDPSGLLPCLSQKHRPIVPFMGEEAEAQRS